MNPTSSLETYLTDPRLAHLAVGFVGAVECLSFLKSEDHCLLAKKDDLHLPILFDAEIQAREIVEKRQFVIAAGLLPVYFQHFTDATEGRYLLTLHYLFAPKAPVEAERLAQYHYRDLVYREILRHWFQTPGFIPFGPVYEGGIEYLSRFAD